MKIDVEQLKRSEERAESIEIEKAESVLIDSLRRAEEEVSAGANLVRPSEILRSSRSDLLKEPFAESAMKANIDGEMLGRIIVGDRSKIDERELERRLDGDDSVGELFLLRALLAAKPICRISVRNEAEHEISCATGFLIAPELLLTNWHVFKSPDWAVKSVAEFDYTLDVSGEPAPSFRFRLEPHRFFVSDNELDYALVAVNPLSFDGTTELSRFGYHRLIPAPGKINEREWITIIQHPGGSRRKYAIRDNLVIHRKDEDDFMWYKSDTAQGSSGSPAFNDSFQIVALHHLGRAHKENGKYLLQNNTWVDSLEGLDDSQIKWIANEGLRVSVLCDALERRLKNSNDEIVKNLFAVIGGNGGIMSNTTNGKELITNNQIENKNYSETSATAAQMNSPANFVTINVPTDLDKPLHLSLGFGDRVLPPSNVVENLRDARKIIAPSEEEAKKQVEPYIDNDYSNRRGYDEDFLDIKVSLPEVEKTGSVSKMDNGEYVISYEHFSIVMNTTRRLALFTATNVDGAKKARKPVAGPSYTRDGLGGLKKGDDEYWRTDPRIPELHQLPNTFYNEDRRAFHRGHINRREDVCWGKTYEQIRKANGDTYHTTNCSPQVGNFNSSLEDGEWGFLENFILNQAKKMGDKYCIFAGPVFEEDDEWFDGYDDRGKIRVQIPRRFWKIVVTRFEDELQTFAFVLEQDLTSVDFEETFQVNAHWSKEMIGIQELEDTLTNIRFPQVFKDTDQHQKND